MTEVLNRGVADEGDACEDEPDHVASTMDMFENNAAGDRAAEAASGEEFFGIQEFDLVRRSLTPGLFPAMPVDDAVPIPFRHVGSAILDINEYNIW
jgi:hypothetical protein